MFKGIVSDNGIGIGSWNWNWLESWNWWKNVRL